MFIHHFHWFELCVQVYVEHLNVVVIIHFIFLFYSYTFQYNLVRWPRVKRLLSEQEIFKLMNAKSFFCICLGYEELNQIPSIVVTLHKNTHQCNKQQQQKLPLLDTYFHNYIMAKKMDFHFSIFAV